MTTQWNEWMSSGLCSQTDPELWFPEKGGNNAPAIALCMECPVGSECLDYAMSFSQDALYGVWAGFTRADRRGNNDKRAAQNAAKKRARRNAKTGQFQ